MKLEVLAAILERCESCPDCQENQCLNDECLFHEEYQQFANHGSVEIECDVYSYIQRRGLNGTWE